MLDDNGTANNCLDAASAAAKDGQDDIVFLNNNAPGANGVGHVVVENAKTGQVTDPEALGGSTTSSDMASYLAQTNANGARFSVAASASAADVHRILTLPPDQRATAIANDDPNLVGIENQNFADTSTSVTVGSNGDLTAVVSAGGSSAAGGQSPMLSVSGTGTDGTPLSVGVSGGVWSSSNMASLTALSGSNVATLQSLGAMPQVAPGQLADSASDAQKLATGTTVQSLLSSGQSTDAVNGAYELLGISNRQISLYSKAAAQGGYGSNPPIFGSQNYTPTGTAAFAVLKTAAQMRAEASDSGMQDIQSLGNGITIIGTGQGAVAALPTSLTSSTAGGLGFSGMYDALVGGIKSANVFWSPSTVANSMLYGDTGVIKAITPAQSAFGGHDAASAQAALSKGQSALSASTVTVNGAFGYTPAQLSDAAGILTGLSNQGRTWTPQTVDEAFYAAGEIMQGVSPSLSANPPSVAATAGTATEAAAAQTQAVTAALRQNGITGIDAQAIGQTLLSALTSPAFATATGGQQQNANAALSLMQFYDPSNIVPAALADKYGNALSGGTPTAAQNLGRKMLASELSQISQTTLPNATTVPTGDQKTAAALTVSAWAVASARWLLDGIQQFGETASPELQSKLATYGSLIQEGIDNAVFIAGNSADVPLTVAYKTASGQDIANNLPGLYTYAAKLSGLTSLLPPTKAEAFTRQLAQGDQLASTIDKIGIAAVGALGNMGIRAYQINQADALGLDQSTVNNLIAYTTADSLAYWNWAMQANRLGPALGTTIAAIEQNSGALAGQAVTALGAGAVNTVPGLSSLASWAGLYAGQAPVGVDPTSTIGKFFNWVFTQLTGVGALGTYGLLNLGNGLTAIKNGAPVIGSLQTAVGAADVAKGLYLLAGQSNPDRGPIWATINGFGQASNGLLIATRFASSLAALNLAWLNRNG